MKAIGKNIVIEKIRKAELIYEGEKIWANIDKPLDIRALHEILFYVKSIIINKGEIRS